MAKKIDLNKTVYELVNEYPELVDIMAGLGFTEITKKPVLNSVGKMMTIPKGAKMKGISMMDVVTAFISNGFELVGEMPAVAFPGAGAEKPAAASAASAEKSVNEEPVEVEEAASSTQPVADNKEAERRTLLKSYLERLRDGEDLETVRADFVENFSGVDASEIMAAEQEMMKEGTPITEVQRLCDIHSALFHGATREEKIANAEKAVQEEMIRKRAQEELAHRDSYPKKVYSDKNQKAAALEAVKGHPLYTFTKENDALAALLEEYKENGTDELFQTLRQISIHYAKKGDLLYPLLKVKYGITGPSDVMWTVDDEIRDEMGDLEKETQRGDEWKQRVEAVLKRADEMIYKEQNILFPICAVNFTEEEWYGIYRDSKDYADSFGVKNETWDEAEDHVTAAAAPAKAGAGEVVMPGGHMTVEQLTALLNTIPGEITFVDADDINRFFDEGPKVFKRPGMAIDRKVFSCHPPKVEPLVRSIIDGFRNGTSDVVPVWMEKGGRTMLVRYMAVRDRDGKYLGTLEFVEDMEFAKEHFLG
ncbi:DUF438 domain-containing protein [Mobilibacterium timonense]|uniref:DUF438 domain-containing protein n=1 Tax=Mobilibacterium timonense TaxID=1871012 RepID=UPI000985E3EC|nr:DUF438 domain-containing protein [Mobilibacterium timonense]